MRRGGSSCAGATPSRPAATAAGESVRHAAVDARRGATAPSKVPLTRICGGTARVLAGRRSRTSERPLRGGGVETTRIITRTPLAGGPWRPRGGGWEGRQPWTRHGLGAPTSGAAAARVAGRDGVDVVMRLGVHGLRKGEGLGAGLPETGPQRPHKFMRKFTCSGSSRVAPSAWPPRPTPRSSTSRSSTCSPSRRSGPPGAGAAVLAAAVGAADGVGRAVEVGHGDVVPLDAARAAAGGDSGCFDRVLAHVEVRPLQIEGRAAEEGPGSGRSSSGA